MNAFAPWLVFASAAILLILGAMHLVYTFHGPKLSPRDHELKTRMKEVSPVITRETTMWKAWVGFNATHSFGLILFGAVYAYLALAHAEWLFQSFFLLWLGAALLLGYTWVAKQYFFRIPFRGMVLASALYALALTAIWI